MAEPSHFDLMTTPLSGTNLIEAGAGTGKTFAITGLFLRLLVEKHLPVDSILVVTFTEAATDELKARIRDKIRAAVAVFSGSRTDDPFLRRLRADTPRPEMTLNTLKQALLAFDQAAIHTIHGFCWKILRENAFESGHRFESELSEDQETLKEKIVADFWRCHFYEASPLFVDYALEKGVSMASLLTLIHTGLAHVDLTVVPRPESPDTSVEEAAYKQAFDTVSRTWASVKTEIRTLLATHEGLNRTRYPVSKIPDWVAEMDHYLAAGSDRMRLFQNFEKFTHTALQSAARKGYKPLCHPFFEQCEQLKNSHHALSGAYEKQLLALKGKLFEFVNTELTTQKRQRNILSFEDLLLKVNQALRGSRGSRLRRVIREKFKAALIDEFQDTDPVQYTIFNRLFAVKSHILFLVGDPKQAIYGFRGADVFAYIKASNAVKSRYTLRDNWRSDPGLIHAINRIFSHTQSPFVYGAIPFAPARPADKPRECLSMGDHTGAPFQLWFLSADQVYDKVKAISKTDARGLIADAVAGEIARLVSAGEKGEGSIGERPIRERDIAVLVRRNADAVIVKQALTARGIQSVVNTTGNLFDAREALEMEQVLAAVAEPNNEELIRTALGTQMMGLSGEDLDRMTQATQDWEQWLVAFRRYREIWESRGFIRMMRHLIFREGMLCGVMALSDGERRATNLLHLTEVLHRVETEERLRVHGLLKWLQEQRAPDTPRRDTHQLRLESDEDLVKIVTIHKSKGLEYPVVFCPFLWDSAVLPKPLNHFVFHDEAHDGRATLDLGSKDVEDHKRFAEKERLAENLRLLYVSLTRAKHRCYMVWGRFNQAQTAAPAYLLHAHDAARAPDPVQAVATEVKGKDEAAMRADLRGLVSGTGTGATPNGSEVMALTSMPLPSEEIGSEAVHPATVPLTARTLSGMPDPEWRVSSFSSLISGHVQSPDTSDRDMASPEDPEVDMGAVPESGEIDPWSIFAFPRGARAGLCLHDVLEHLDFTEVHGAQTETLVEQKLSEYGFEPGWKTALGQMILKVMAVPLTAGTKRFTLSQIPLTRRLNELAFTFPLRRVTPKTFRQLFQTHPIKQMPESTPQWIEGLEFSPAKGFMKGFMDLVFEYEDRFYLVDWKSNFLGPEAQAYDQAALGRSMADHGYILQYHLYALALDQYLTLRVKDYRYDTHFGGIYYIFLRGVDPQHPELGIYRDRPAPEVMQAFHHHLVDNTSSTHSLGA